MQEAFNHEQNNFINNNFDQLNNLIKILEKLLQLSVIVTKSKKHMTTFCEF